MLENLFAPYNDYSLLDIVLEIIAVLFGLASVLYSKKNNIKVYPTGIVSTLLFTYLLYQWGLFGDMVINIYYFVMSIYGWYLWSLNKEGNPVIEISKTTPREYVFSIYIFIGSSLFIGIIYWFFEKFGSWWSYVDILTTGLFFIGMWLLAKRKIEHWLFLIVGDFISIPLYYLKGYTLTSMLFLVYTIIAILGYLEWKKNWSNRQVI